MFRTVPLSIIRSFSLYTQQWCMSYRSADSVLSANLYVLLRVQWKTPDDGQRICPKHVEFYSKNKFEKLVHLVGFVTRIYQDSRSPELQIRHRGHSHLQCLIDVVKRPMTSMYHPVICPYFHFLSYVIKACYFYVFVCFACSLSITKEMNLSVNI